MTRFLLDVASYQGALTPEAVKAAGFTAVNLKISHGLGTKSVHPEIGQWVTRARALGLGISTFHWLTDDVAGERQADHAYQRMVRYGVHTGAAHQLDVEAKPAPALASVRGYLTRMTSLLGRPVALYTGDWWWSPRGWDVSDLTPYLWSAPNAGYRGSYPGDDSAHWTASYGGWPELAVMQYAMRPLPGGTIDVSMSAIRDESVWTALTLGRQAVTHAPESIMDARAVMMSGLRARGLTVQAAAWGVVGDDKHAATGNSYHLGKSSNRGSSYSLAESTRDRLGATEAASALDCGWFSFKADGQTHDLRSFSRWLVEQCKAGAKDTLDIREIIYSPDGKTVRRWDRLAVRSSGDDSHLTHTHISWFRDSERRDKTALFKRWFAEIDKQEDDVLDANDKKWFMETFAPKVAEETWGAQLGTYGSAGGQMQTLMVRSNEVRTVFMPALSNAVAAILKNVIDDDAVAEQTRIELLAAIEQSHSPE